MSSTSELARRISRLERDLRRATTGPQLAHSSLDDGAIAVYDAEGTLRMILGTQYDGTAAPAVVSGPRPPTPFMPGATGVRGGLVVVWSGLWEDPAAVAPMDFARVEVHVSTDAAFTPSTSTLRGVFSSPLGGEMFVALTDVVEHYVRLVARSESGKPSYPSVAVAGTPLASTPTQAEQTFTIAAVGAQTLTLSQPPTGRVDLWWGGAWQPATEWSIAGAVITVPSSPLLAVGQKFVVKYDV